MRNRFMFVLFTSACVAPTLRASIFFTLDDPGPGPEIAYFEGTDNATNPGLFTYIGAPLDLDVDGTQEGLGVQTFVAQLQMSLTIGAIDGTLGSALSAPILGGSFSLVDTNAGNETIFSGALSGGGLLTLSTVGALIATSSTGGLTLAEGPALAGFLGGLQLAPTFDISFTLTNISPAVSINQNNFLTTFTANSAFTGNAELIPTPGSLALFGLGAMSLCVRRRGNG